MVIAIINGPNLNLLGAREPEIYGTLGFEEFLVSLSAKFKGVTFQYFQSNVEGELISEIQKCGVLEPVDGIVLNAGGYSHTSVAIADAVKSCKIPVIQVHISNIFSREPQRHVDLLSSYVSGGIYGLGLNGYSLAIEHIIGLNST